MKKSLKLFGIFLSLIMCASSVVIYAASVCTANITASSKSITVGKSVTITATTTAGAWNLELSGGGQNKGLVGQTNTTGASSASTSITFKPSKAGTYTFYLKGDITDYDTDATETVSKSVTITAKEKPKEEPTTKPTTNNNNTTTNKNNTTTTNKNNTTTPTKKSSNANISSLRLSVEGFKFSSNQTTYNIKVGEDVNNITANVTLAHSKAVYSISGNKNLKAGNNVIKIVVTAEDGTTKTYKINVEKAGNFEETSSELTNLIIEDMTLDKEFSSTVTEYNGGTVKYAKSLNILPYAKAEQAKVEILNNENLKEGENTVVIKVTSKDGTSTTEYKVTFNMLPEEETNALTNVTIYSEAKTPTYEGISAWDGIKESLKNHTTIILLYVLALIEFAQVVYLYVQLKSVNPGAVEVKRRNNSKNKEN